MKRIIALVLVIASLAILLCACGKFECDLCGKEKSGKKYTDELLGEEITYCEDCKEDLEDLGNLLG